MAKTDLGTAHRLLKSPNRKTHKRGLRLLKEAKRQQAVKVK